MGRPTSRPVPARLRRVRLFAGSADEPRSRRAIIPIFNRLGVTPQTVLAAYRVGDSPMNVVTPLMVYLPFIVTIAQRYKRDAGIGTVIALMLPFVVVILIAWIALFVGWFLLGVPIGPGYPISG
ncbi:MAG: AbgT family transporter [Acidimicrobiales bacterium]|jgi:aminobenzoyl-glutamate transport protein|nr:AbgT family transporter [Acidimicrobiales bacterium]HLV89664.1 AbgT family transporter [Acidimicrobiia bacterium]